MDKKQTTTISGAVKSAPPTFPELLKAYSAKIPAVGIDFETFYDDDCSVANTTYWGYTHHPKFDAYMVAVYSHDLDINFVGHPKDFDWSLIDGTIALAHNSPFDRAVFERITEDGALTSARPFCWVNTADLSVYFKGGRRLAMAARNLLGRSLNKGVREEMKGKKFSDIPKDRQKAWLDYALEDSVCCVELWDKYKNKWPKREQLISLHTSELVKRGVAVDLPLVESQLKVVERAAEVAEMSIPWAGEPELTAKGRPRTRGGQPLLKKPASSKELAYYARENGIPLPSTTNEKSKEFQEWEEKWGEKFPVIRSMQTWRKCIKLQRTFEDIINRTRPDGRMEFQLTYFGAHTGRWSGGKGRAGDHDEKGINLQTMRKDVLMLDRNLEVTSDECKAQHFIDTRACFIADEGKQMCISDLSQIEPRVLAHLVGDEDFLELVRQGMSPYEAHARMTMGWTGGKLKKEDPLLYAFAKARVLALGYQAGWKKFIEMAAMYISKEQFIQIFHKNVSALDKSSFRSFIKQYAEKDFLIFDDLPKETQNIWVNSWLTVNDFRSRNPLIKKFWDEMQRTFIIDANRKEDMHVVLPSKRELSYFEPRRYEQSASTMIGGHRVKFYGGKLVENITQAVARDVFVECIINLEKKGYQVLWHVHDEAILELNESQTLEQVEKLMTTTPTWIPDLPVESESNIVPHYTK